MITVRETEDRRLFIEVQRELYKGDKFFVPPLEKEEMKLLDTEKNPFYKNASIKLFIAYKDNKPVGRIASIVNRNHNRYHNDKTGFFGFFESIDDVDVAKELFGVAEDYLKANGMNHVRGPTNPSMNDSCGFLLHGYFQEPVFMMPYNRKYYHELVEACGFKKEKDLFAFYLSTSNKPRKRLLRLAEYVQRKYRITLRSFSKRHLERDLDIVWELYCKAWADNWSFTPPTKEEFYYGMEDFKTIVPEELVMIAEKDSKPCGFAAVVPDFNLVLKHVDGRITPFNAIPTLLRMKKIDSYRLLTLGVLPEFRKMGVDLLLYIRSFEVVEKRGGRGGELSWTLEDNDAINRPIIKMNAEHYKTYRMYGKPLI